MLTLAKETSCSSISPSIWVMSATLEIALICSIGTNLRTSSLRCAYTMSFRVYPFAKRTSLLKWLLRCAFASVSIHLYDLLPVIIAFQRVLSLQLLQVLLLFAHLYLITVYLFRFYIICLFFKAHILFIFTKTYNLNIRLTCCSSFTCTCKSSFSSFSITF